MTQLGWLESIRIPGNIGFITLRKPLENEEIIRIQLVIKNSDLIKKVQSIPRESYVSVQFFEDQNDKMVQKIELIHKNEELNPPHLGKKNSFQAENSLKSDQFLNIELMKSKVLKKIRGLFESNDFIEHPCQKLLSGSTEGGSEVFVTTCNKFLAQSPQLQKQLLVNSGIKKVYDIGNVFRAEKFKTTRHITEYTSIDYQMATDNLDETISFAVKIILAAFHAAGKNYSSSDFITISYKKAIEIAEVSKLDRAGELKLFEKIDAPFIIVKEYPEEGRPFYTKKKSSFDILCPKFELCSGSLRENDHSQLLKKIIASGLDPESESIKNYLGSFKKGSPLTGGAAIGLERLLVAVMNLDSVHDTNKYHLV